MPKAALPGFFFASASGGVATACDVDAACTRVEGATCTAQRAIGRKQLYFPALPRMPHDRARAPARAVHAHGGVPRVAATASRRRHRGTKSAQGC
jgi:hypothetical protein